MCLGREKKLRDSYCATIYYSKVSDEIIAVNKEFERSFCEASNVIGHSLDEVTQPILQDDFITNSNNHKYKEYVFLNIANARSELVALHTTEAEFEGSAVWLITVSKLFGDNSADSSLSAKGATFYDSDDFLFLVNDEGKFERVNQQACKKLGYSRAELLGMQVTDIAHNSVQAYTRKKWEALLRRDKATGEHLLATRDGAAIYVECRGITNVRLGLHLLIFREIGDVKVENEIQIRGEYKSKAIDTSFNGVIFTDSEFKIRYVNEPCLDILGHDKREDILRESIVDFCTQNKMVSELKKNVEENNEWQGNVEIKRKDGEKIPLKVKVNRLPIEGTDDSLWQWTVLDITELLKTEQASLLNESRFNRLLQAAPDGILIADHEGVIKFCNSQISEMLGYEKEEMIGQPVEMLIPQKHAKGHVKHRRQYVKNPHKRPMGSGLELYAKHKDGRQIPVDIMLGPFDENGTQSVIAIIRDITKFKEAQNKLRREKEFSNLLQDITAIANENRSLNEALAKSISEICEFMDWPVGHVYLPADDGSGEFYPTDIWHLKDEKEFDAFRKMTMCTRFSPGMGMVGEVIESGTAQWYMNANENPGFVRRMPDMDLKIRACFGLPILVQDKVMGVLEFFSDQVVPEDATLLKKMTTVGRQLGRSVERANSNKLIKKNIELFRQLFEHSPAGVITLNDKYEVINVNQSFCKIFGYEPEELEDQRIDELLVPENLGADALEINRQTFCGQILSEETIRLHKNGSEVPVVLHTVPVTIDEEVIAIFGIYVDVTDVKKTESQLRESLTEKKFLLEEIHHRVKNNLAIITSLLELQINQANDAGIVRQLRDSQSRIFSMALVHEHLYQMESFSCLDLEIYIKSLCKKLKSTFQDPGSRIEFKFNTNTVRVTLDQAISCGQLINELVTNAIKHAFPDGQDGVISISLSENSGTVELKISDDGKGIPDEFTTESSSSLGLKLVQTLTRQLQGELNIDNSEGTEFRICFTKEEVESHPNQSLKA